jgi:hypothetical protein
VPNRRRVLQALVVFRVLAPVQRAGWLSYAINANVRPSERCRALPVEQREVVSGRCCASASPKALRCPHSC